MTTDLLTIWGREILSVAILIPLVWYLLRNQDRTNKEYLKTFKQWFKDLEISLGKKTGGNWRTFSSGFREVKRAHQIGVKAKQIIKIKNI